MTVAWSRAFKSAAAFVGYTIAWDIIAGILIFFGFFVVLGGTGLSLRPNPYQVIVGLILTILGFILGLLGNIATFFKIQTDMITDEMGERFAEESKADS